jgi:cysteinyl-tRNA synthetase
MRQGVYALRKEEDALPKGEDALPKGEDPPRSGESNDDSAEPDPALMERFTSEINDDLNVPRALTVAWETLRGDSPPASRRATLLRFDSIFGLKLAEWVPKKETAPDAVVALAEARLRARRSKAWPEADRLRAELHAAGWEMEDRPDGYALKRK